MGGFAQAITQGAGRAGNELEGARTGLRDERQQGAFDKLKMLQLALGLMELQQKIKQGGQPQPFGTVGTPGGGTSGVTFQPGKGFGTTSLIPGIGKESVSAQIRAMSTKSTSKEYQTVLTELADSVDKGLIDPMKAMERALYLTGTEAGKETQQKTRFKFEPTKGIISDAAGTEWSIYDPQLPPDLKKLVDAEQKRSDEKERLKIEDEERRNQNILTRGLEIADARDAIKASSEARQAKTVADDVDKNVEAAKRGNAKASLALVFAAVRTMVQGAGRMTNVEIEQELRAGSYEQRVQRWYTQASSGVLPEDQMGMIQEIVHNGYEAKRATAADTWEYARPGKPLPAWLKPTGQSRTAKPADTPGSFQEDKKP